MLDGENLSDNSGDWVDESADDSHLQEANRIFGLMSLSPPQTQDTTKSKPEMESRTDSQNVKPLPRDANSIPNWLIAQIEPGTNTETSKIEAAAPSDQSKAPTEPLPRSDTVPQWMLQHIRRDETDTEASTEPPEPPITLKRKSVSWDTSALQDHPPRPAPATPRYSLRNPNTPFHHPSSISSPQTSQIPIDQEEATLDERLGQAAENRDRNYTGAEGRRIEWESARRMSAEMEGWEEEVRQTLEARERRGGPLVQWVKKEMRDKARGLWRKVTGKR